MGTATLRARVLELRRFFAHRSATSWAKELPSRLADEEISEAYRQEEQQRHREAEELVATLAETGDHALLAELTTGARQELLLTVCTTLRARPWPKAVPIVLKEFNRKPNPQVRTALLGLVADTGAIEGYGPARETLSAKERAVWTVAKKALQTIRKANPAVAWLEQVDSEPEQPLGALDPAQVVDTLLLVRSVPEAIRLMARLRHPNPSAWELLIGSLITRASTSVPKTKGEDDGPRMAALILAGLPAPLPLTTAKFVRKAFLTIGEQPRTEILQAADPEASSGLIEACLNAKPPRIIAQGLATLRSERRDLIPTMRPQLQRLTSHQDQGVLAQALELLGTGTAQGALRTEAVHYQRLLNPEVEQRPAARFAPTFASAVGRTVLADSMLTPTLWAEMAAWARSNHPVEGLNETYQALADALLVRLGGSEASLTWLIGLSDLVSPETLVTVGPSLTQAIVARTLFATDVVFDALCSALHEALPLWGQLASAVLPLAAGAQTGRLRQLLSLQVPSDSTPKGLFNLLGHVEAQMEAALTTVADLRGSALVEAQRWLEGPGITFLEIMQRAVRQSHPDVLEARKRLQSLWDHEWKTQASTINRLITEVEGVLAPHLSSHPHWQEPLETLMTQLGQAVFDREPPSPESLPRPVTAEKDPLLAYREALLVRQEIASRLQGERTRLRTGIGTDAAPTIEALLLLLHGTDAVQAVTYPFLRWMNSLGLQPIEPILGPGPYFAPIRHESSQALTPGAPVSVLCWGLARGELMLRKALVEAI